MRHDLNITNIYYVSHYFVYLYIFNRIPNLLAYVKTVWDVSTLFPATFHVCKHFIIINTFSSIIFNSLSWSVHEACLTVIAELG